MSRRIRPKSSGVSTLDIWPWKYLVPWMREDLFARRDARKLGKLRRINEITDPYNMEEMVMPLHDFINDPVAHEIVHNGATFQVAGLTNNSYFSEAHEVRQCVRKHPTLGRAVLEVAKSRLDRMLYVGLTEDHKKSARLFVNMVGAQVLSQSKALSSSDVETQASARTELSSSFPESKTGGPDQLQARLLVPEAILQQIISLNSLDVELYRHAESIFLQQKHHIHKAQGS
ncbi:Protein-tyrosine sulfotransferase [Ananas comosus]|uniref:Protein-tyrosine sulfotransferase n=1 Tax=Ananas comosus TaxID=4615 RepID=A0A199URG2_ANACO|nr:Protein-tyrosine sulfotransferase [Ananas comosus]